MTDPRPDLLVDPGWLVARLDDPLIRVFDCRATREARPEGPSLYRNERDAWAAQRIPGAGYLHMVDDLCDPSAHVPFTLASPEQVTKVMAAAGARPDQVIVLYGDAGESPVHRVWWALTASGFPDVRVLDGGFSRWRAEDLPVATSVPEPPAQAPAFELTPHPEMRADKADVEASLSDPRAVRVNALSREHFEGGGDQVFGRRGRIPRSVSIPAADLVESKTGRFLPLRELEARMDRAGLAKAAPLIPYCGGGIAASTVAFVLHLLGRDDVALYDGSLMEWGADPEAPMER